MRGQLHIAGVRQDRDVHVDVYRGSVSAQHGNRYVFGDKVLFTFCTKPRLYFVYNLFNLMCHAKSESQNRFKKERHENIIKSKLC